MKITYLVVVLGFIGLLSGIYWLWQRGNDSPSVSLSGSEEARFADATTVRYTSERGDITVAYMSDLARVTGGDYDGVVFRQVVAASGAKYAGERGVTLWTKNNEVRIETPQRVVYTGVAVAPEAPALVAPTIPTETDIPATTTASTTEPLPFADTTWVWQSAVRGNEEIQPEKAEAFSLLFSADGSLRGTTDCNGFGGEYTKNGDEITLGALSITLMFCEQSEESLFLELVESPLTITSLTDGTLELKNASGALLRFKAE